MLLQQHVAMQWWGIHGARVREQLAPDGLEEPPAERLIAPQEHVVVGGAAVHVDGEDVDCPSLDDVVDADDGRRHRALVVRDAHVSQLCPCARRVDVDLVEYVGLCGLAHDVRHVLRERLDAQDVEPGLRELDHLGAVLDSDDEGGGLWLAVRR